ncbi:MAG TPA: filamentous hemagglutinin N-terminal domain-containing protein [Vineibacter sp.]|nr:filamentous hemagglutinin N-terminal domain-containing protein [Vineibacter sp.]
MAALGLLAGVPQVRAQVPTGGSVVAGQASITSTTNQVTVTQSTSRGVIDWRSFSIGPQARVDFLQPGVSAVTLNRVTGPDPSLIAGQLTANGQIVLVNQAGVFFANGAQVNVGSLIASTASISDPRRFMAGGPVTFDVASPHANAAVDNAGNITVRDGGLVGLAGHAASNSGTITARLGRVTVGGAETFTVDLAGDGLINFQLGQPVSRPPLDPQGNKRPLASNTGTINADGGVVTMTARAAGSVVDSVVNVGGTIRARAVAQHGGVLILDGGDGGTLNVSGTLDVSGRGAGQRGGQVVATARGGQVNVAATARIDASGDSGGGRVTIGGSTQGNGTVASARDLNVAPGARITADATRQGDGGTVILWADNATVFGGNISARGGPQGGDGGFIETSGRASLTVLDSAWVDASATAGRAGTWLLDPTNITIDQPLADLISSILNSGSNVTVSTSGPGSDPGDITMPGGVSISWSTSSVLSFNADRNIFISGSLVNSSSTVGILIVFNAALSDPMGGVFVDGTIIIPTSATVYVSPGSFSPQPPLFIGGIDLPCLGLPGCDVPPDVNRTPPDERVPVGTPPQPLVFDFDRTPPTPLNLTDFVLVNQGNEDLFNVDDAQRQRRAARGGK